MKEEFKKELESLKIQKDSNTNDKLTLKNHPISLFDYAIEENDIEAVKLLLELQNNNGDYIVDISSGSNKSLMIASEIGNTEVVDLLLRAKDAKGNYRLDQTPLWFNIAINNAVLNGHIGVVDLLLKAKYDNGNYRVKFTDNDIINSAIQKNHIEIVRLLLEAKYDNGKHKVNLDDDSEVMNFAIKNNRIEIVKLLLEAKDNDGNYRLDLSVNNYETIRFMQLNNSRIEIFRLLLEAKDNDGSYRLNMPYAMYKILIKQQEKETYSILVAYILDRYKDQVQDKDKEEYQSKIIKDFQLNEGNCNIFLDNITFFMKEKELNIISIEPIIDSAESLAKSTEKAEDKHIKKLLGCHKEYNLSKSSKESFDYAKSQKVTDIDNFKLTCRGILNSIRLGNGFFMFPKEAFDIILSFMSGWQKLQIERNLFQSGILPQHASDKKIRDARNKQLSL